jgi:hypothetical protein
MPICCESVWLQSHTFIPLIIPGACRRLRWACNDATRLLVDETILASATREALLAKHL